MLCKWQNDGVFLVVVSKTRGFDRDTLKDVVHEGVHDAHGLAGDAKRGNVMVDSRHSVRNL